MGHFDHLNVAFFTKAAIYPGSIGTFRYRFQREGWTDGKGTLTVWVYENTSFELAGGKVGGTGQPALFHPLPRPPSGMICTGMT